MAIEKIKSNLNNKIYFCSSIKYIKIELKCFVEKMPLQFI